MWAARKITHTNTRGFTIVELLIVIVVIAVLAAIAIVAFNGAQARASFSRYQADMKSIVKALELYKAENGSYPVTTNQDGCTYHWCGWDQVTGDDFITGLSPKYIERIPQMPSNLPREETFLYRSDGINYQLIRFSNGLPTVEIENNPLHITSNGYEGKAWGYKTNSDGWW